MYHILVDWKQEEEFFIEKSFIEKGIKCRVYDIPNYSMKDRTKAYRVFNLYFKYLQLAYKAVKNSDKYDIILCWNFTTSIATGYICKLLNKKRNIIGLNIIAHRRTPLIDYIRKLIFQPILNEKTYYLTVNSSLYIDDYSKRFNVSKDKFFVLNDAVSLRSRSESSIDKDYIFVGGEAQRDWQTLFKACMKIPNINFICIARRKYFDHSLVIPSNVTLYFDTDQKTFDTFMSESSLVVIPVKSQLPCGLIILLDAAMMRKPIIATNTPSISNYIENEKSGFLFEQGNEIELVEKIQKLFHNTQMQNKFSTNLLDFVIKNHSRDNYMSSLLSILQQINKKK